MDALFGLPRKKSAGISHREPLFQDLVFCDQSTVDQFVQMDSDKSKSATDMNVSTIIQYPYLIQL